MLKVTVQSLRAIIFFLLLAGASLAQTSSQQPPPAQPPETQPQSASQAAPAAEHHITQAEADELFRAVDDILKFDSEATGLPIKHAVKRKLTSRKEVEKFFIDGFKDDESAKHLTQAEVVLKKFGLIPRDSSLEGTLLALYTEAVAGYYDPKTKTVNLLDWLDPDSQKPVLAHELTHALQDQNFNLLKFMKNGKQKKVGKYDVTTSEAMSARVALMEGQAAAVMVDYLLAPQGQTVQSNPEIARAVQAGMLGDGGSLVMKKAPLYLKEDLKFPYTFGLNFVLDMLKLSKAKAFSDSFQNPPADTREIMQPQTYLENQKVAPLPMPDLDHILGHDWERFDVDSVGQFDISVLAREYGAPIGEAEKMATTWRHGYYFAAAKHGVRPIKPGEVALIYVSRWSSPEAAHAFAELDGNSLKKRYQNAEPVSGDSGHWTTEEGDVFIEQHGDIVIVTEGFDRDLSSKLRSSALDKLR
jgi:hypothetical protein